MTDLERRALLGNTEAQRECTEKGIVLPCPQCYGHVSIMGVAQSESMTRMTFVCDNGCMGVTWTQDFVYSSVDRKPLNPSPLARWNERHAPPIGRCGECAHWYKKHCAHGTCATEPTDADFYCGSFKPKED